MLHSGFINTFSQIVFMAKEKYRIFGLVSFFPSDNMQSSCEIEMKVITILFTVQCHHFVLLK